MHDGIRKSTQMYVCMYVHTALTLCAASTGDTRLFVLSLEFRNIEIKNWNRSSNSEACVMICPMIFLLLPI